MKRKISWLLTLCLIWNIALLCGGCKPETIEVTVQPNNGDAVVTLNVEKGALIENLPTPQKRACDFVGWYQGDAAWDLATNTVSEPITLTAKWKLSADAFEQDPNAGVRAEGTDIRACSFNVLGSEVGSKISVESRIDGFVNMINAYQPDVIAFQEFNKDWILSFRTCLADAGYRLLSGDGFNIKGTGSNINIGYNAAVLELLDYNRENYMVERGYVWALFETKNAAKQQFLVISTHWSLTTELRNYQGKELANIVKKFQEEYKVPVLVMGDLNTYEVNGDQFRLTSYNDSESYHLLVNNAALTDAKYAATKRGLVGETFHRGDGTGSRDDLTSGFWKLGPVSFIDSLVDTYVSIDHILYTKEIEALYYDTIIDEGILYASDHNPIYADIKFVNAS